MPIFENGLFLSFDIIPGLGYWIISLTLIGVASFAMRCPSHLGGAWGGGREESALRAHVRDLLR